MSEWEAGMEEEIAKRRYRFTIEQFLRMGQKRLFPPPLRVELVDGLVFDLNSTGSAHSAVCSRVHRVLVRQVGDSLMWLKAPLIVGPRDVTEPDVAVVRRRDDFYASGHPRADDALMVVEVAEGSRDYDLATKAPLYARAGIPEYWVADVDTGTVVVHHSPADGEYTDVREIARDGSWTSPSLGGREIRALDVLGPAESQDTR